MGIHYMGEAATLNETSSGVAVTFGFALLVVLLVLAAQFESFVSAVIIMFTVPFGLAAAVLRHRAVRRLAQHLQPDRPRHAGRHHGEERHPDRGVRQPAARAGLQGARRHPRGLPHPPAAGGDDHDRDGGRRRAAGDIGRRRRRKRARRSAGSSSAGSASPPSSRCSSRRSPSCCSPASPRRARPKRSGWRPSSARSPTPTSFGRRARRGPIRWRRSRHGIARAGSPRSSGARPRGIGPRGLPGGRGHGLPRRMASPERVRRRSVRSRFRGTAALLLSTGCPLAKTRTRTRRRPSAARSGRSRRATSARSRG